MYKYIHRLDISLNPDHSSLTPSLTHPLTPSLISRLLYRIVQNQIFDNKVQNQNFEIFDITVLST